MVAGEMSGGKAEDGAARRAEGMARGRTHEEHLVWYGLTYNEHLEWIAAYGKLCEKLGESMTWRRELMMILMRDRKIE